VPAAYPWDLLPRQAITLQKELAELVREEPLKRPVQTIAGTDVSIKGGIAHAAVVVVETTAYAVIDRAFDTGRVAYPYVPGLLAWREIPPLLRALQKLSTPFDLLMTDGHGRVHPRRFGLACHLGLLLDKPAVGVAKRPYVGTFGALAPDKGAVAPLVDAKTQEVLGAAVRTRAGVRPVYVSVGHRAVLQDAVALVLRSVTRYRLPEPTRQAHIFSRRLAG